MPTSGERVDTAGEGPSSKKPTPWMVASTATGRAVVVGVIGMSVIAAALQQNPARTEATQGALLDLAQAPLGHILLAIVSLGLAGYGVYEIVKARYRTIRAA